VADGEHRCIELHVPAGERRMDPVLQVPTMESEEDLAVRLLTRDGVLTHPGYFFDFPHESFLVVSLLTPETAFRDGVTRILRHFDCNVECAAPATP
jgi:aspartate/methionine/tyrosine aminotransferase